jgi:3-deoxy-D-manno-octulosonic-acid transferase
LKIKGIYFLYRSFQALALPLAALYFLWRFLRSRGYWKSLPQRLGFLPASFRQTGPGAIWLHAVSVGEILASIEFLKGLRRQFPRTRIFVSTSTLAGHALGEEKLGGLTGGVFYAPADYVWAVRRVLRALQPSLVFIVETEIWPNLLREVKRTGAALAIVNGRISDRAWPRYRALAWFFRQVLPAADCILAQTNEMAKRFLELGARPEGVRIAGNFKHDFDPRPAPPDAPVPALLERCRPTHIWIAASTMPPAFPGDADEDSAVLDAFQRISDSYPGLLLVLAPRKPEQFDVAARKVAAAGIPYLRRSNLQDSSTIRLPGVLLLDSIGELAGLFFAANLVFLGGTLADRGGHNILEPALFAKPVIIGPHMENFQAVAEELRAAAACVEIRDSTELAEAVDRFLASRADASEIGRRAFACAQSKRGVVDRALAAARELYDSHMPLFRASQPWFALGWPSSRLWAWGAHHRQVQALAHRRCLPVPVISVGNITMGGTGKTPCVLRLAAELKCHGFKPGILTRGYGRRSPNEQLVLPAGASIQTESTGDEAQLFLKSGLAPLGVGADRFETGTLLQRDFEAGVLLLDDGFQHRQLDRTLDIVLIDALNPFGGGWVFPLGRLREPPGGLARADIFLVTRADLNDQAAAIEHYLRGWNPRASVFRARLQPKGWVHSRTGTRHCIDKSPFGPAAAFCGLGNPASFRRTLESLSVPLVEWIQFGDHHRYRPGELRHIAAQARAKGASALVTTNKDVVNLCEGAEDLLAPLPLYTLDVTLAIEEEQHFFHEIQIRLDAQSSSGFC